MVSIGELCPTLQQFSWLSVRRFTVIEARLCFTFSELFGEMFIITVRYKEVRLLLLILDMFEEIEFHHSLCSLYLPWLMWCLVWAVLCPTAECWGPGVRPGPGICALYLEMNTSLHRTPLETATIMVCIIYLLWHVTWSMHFNPSWQLYFRSLQLLI